MAKNPPGEPDYKDATDWSNYVIKFPDHEAPTEGRLQNLARAYLAQAALLEEARRTNIGERLHQLGTERDVARCKLAEARQTIEAQRLEIAALVAQNGELQRRFDPLEINDGQ